MVGNYELPLPKARLLCAAFACGGLSVDTQILARRWLISVGQDPRVVGTLHGTLPRDIQVMLHEWLERELVMPWYFFCPECGCGAYLTLSQADIRELQAFLETPLMIGEL